MSGQRWAVTGGADKGGVLVREGKDLNSPQTPSRLATGATVKELALDGERLHFEKLTGDGPDSGWVSIKFKGKDLLNKFDGENPPTPVKGPPRPLKKNFKVKDMGNVSYMVQNTKMKAESEGATREAFFEYLLEQHVQDADREGFRDGIPEHMYNTREADEEECTVYFRSLGTLGPDAAATGSKARKAPGGVHQRVERLGGLSCIVAEADSAIPIKIVVVLAHGNNFFRDDLYGLAHFAVRPGMLFVLPEGTHEGTMPPSSSTDDAAEEEEIEWRRPPRRWWQLSQKVEIGIAHAGKVLAQVTTEALELAPGAKLVLGGFEQGTAVAMAARRELTASVATSFVGLILFAPPANLSPPKESLKGALMLVAVGDADKSSTLVECEQLLKSCDDSGVQTKPLLKYTGAQELTTEVVGPVSAFLTSIISG